MIDDTGYKAANTLLDYLVERAQPAKYVDGKSDWASELKDLGFTPNEIKSIIKRFNTVLNELATNDAFGLYHGGLGGAVEKAGLIPKVGQQAISILKDSNHILQCGRGRGRAVFVLQTTQLEPSEQDKVKVTQVADGPNDKDIIQQLQQKVAELQAKLDEQAMTTWN